MPFLRFSRDKRGYENTYLVHTSNRRGKPSRPRVLYWYRTPPGVRVGRRPFDEEARRRIEAQNPDVTFDWPTIIATPFPPPAENEQWRERRRAERAARQAQRAEDEAALRAEREPEPSIPDAADSEAQAIDLAFEGSVVPELATETTLIEIEPQPVSEVPAEIASGASEAVALQAGEQPQDFQGRKRRRRGGRRRRKHHGDHGALSIVESAATIAGENPETSASSSPGSNESSPDSESGEFDANEE